MPTDPTESTDSSPPPESAQPLRKTKRASLTKASKVKRTRRYKGVVGWREWIQLPDLGVPRVKVKVDTGARSSCLHAFNVEVVEEEGRHMVHFDIHPLQDSVVGTVRASAELLEHRVIRSSSGHEELRPVIRTHVALGDYAWPIEVTLTNRDQMGFRMLLGRRAIATRYTVDPAKSYLQSKKT